MPNEAGEGEKRLLRAQLSLPIDRILQNQGDQAH